MVLRQIEIDTPDFLVRPEDMQETLLNFHARRVPLNGLLPILFSLWPSRPHLDP